MSKYTKLLQVSKEVYNRLLERDNQCIFCKINYRMHPKFPNTMDCMVMDAMHYIPKSKMGLGIEQNLAIGCRYHHHMMDNGTGGYRKEMLKIMEDYLKSIYIDWKKTNLIYRKWD